jgi:translation initiation factor IF-1
MPKKDEIEVEGIVLEALPNAMFKVKIDEEHEILATLSGRIRMNFVRIVPGDKVRVVLSPYDLTRGRIIWRVR